MKYIHIISGIIVGLAVTSCKLDYNPTDAIANSTLTEDDYQYLLTGVYDGAQQFSMGLQNVQDDVAADNLNSRSWCTDIDNNTCTGTSYNIDGWWNQLYYRIQLANNLVNLLEAKDRGSGTLHQGMALPASGDILGRCAIGEKFRRG